MGDNNEAFENIKADWQSNKGEAMICEDHLNRLLRYGRKNGGIWHECDHDNCEQLDDGDVDEIIKALNFYRSAKDNFESFKDPINLQEYMNDLIRQRDTEYAAYCEATQRMGEKIKELERTITRLKEYL